MEKGIYEKVVSKKIAEALKNPELITVVEGMDADEAARYLSEYLQKLIQLYLKDMSDGDEKDDRLHNEVQFANQIVRLMCDSDIGQEDEVDEPGRLLTEVLPIKNSAAAAKSHMHIVRPETSISRPFLFTNSRKDPLIASELRKEAASADRIDLLVSFIRWSGFTILRPVLREFTEGGGKLRVITTTYMGATEARAVEELSLLPNTCVKLSYNVKETRLHAKAYIFHRRSGYSTAYIGSSNLSHAAICEGMEWNVKVTQQASPEIIQKIGATFETYWNMKEFIPFQGTDEENDRLREELARASGRKYKSKSTKYTFEIRPYTYQQEILDELEAERTIHNQYRNLIVAATGTGKTAIAAFDYARLQESRRPKPTRLLFVAHRKEILDQSIAAFRQVLRDPYFGELCVGGNVPEHVEHLFMSIQTFQTRHFWEHMDADYYDMVIVDEFHHAAAPSYQTLLEYFKPSILLGLTATPERMDGASILPYFNNHISAEIRLPDAIEKRLLCPFHYFVAEDPVNLSDVEWVGNHYDTNVLEMRYALNAQSARRRADAIGRTIRHYIASIDGIKGIGFCVSKAHAHFMADYMNEKGVASVALDADSPSNVRNTAQIRLESGSIHFIFVVDIYNEGVDIPSVNTVLFLRPTNSLTVFIQQLGRGLRLCQGKDMLTVLDFIGRQNRKFDFVSKIRALLSGRGLSVKEEVQKGFPHVPKGCYIEMEPVAQECVLENIRAHFSQRRHSVYIEQINDMYGVSHVEPRLRDFLTARSMQPEEFYDGKTLYTALLREARAARGDYTAESAAPYDAGLEAKLTKAMPRITDIDSAGWLRYIAGALESGKAQGFVPAEAPETGGSFQLDLYSQYLRMWQYTIWQTEYDKAGFDTPGKAFTCIKGEYHTELLDLINILFDRIMMNTVKSRLAYPCALDVHATYNRDQIFAALGVNNPISIREGVHYIRDKKTDVFLVTLNKSEKEFSDTTRYEDYSINESLFHWQSQSTTSDVSKTGRRYITQNQTGGNVLIFVRAAKKKGSKTLPYTFLGTAHYVSHEGSRPISIIYHLDEPIPARFMTLTDSSGVL